MAASNTLLDLLLSTSLGGSVRHRLGCTRASHVTGEDGRAPLNCIQAVNRVVSAWVEPAHAPLFMGQKVIVEPMAIAVGTIYTEDIL